MHIGKVLTAANGDWNDDTDLLPGALSYTYQWQRGLTTLLAPTPPTS